MLNGAVFYALIDTGSQVSIINRSMYEQYFNYLPLIDIGQILNVKSVNGQALKYIGAVDLFTQLGRSLTGVNQGVHVNFLVVEDDIGFTPTHGNQFCLIGMNCIEQFWKYRQTCDEHGTRSLLDYAFSNLTKTAYAESRDNGHIGKLRCAETIYLEPFQEVSVKCTFHSKISGMSADILLSGNNKCADSSDVIRSCNLSGFTKTYYPLRNNTETRITITKGAHLGEVFLAGVSFKLNGDLCDSELCLSACEIEVDDFVEQENMFNTQHKSSLTDDDVDDDEMTPDMKDLWKHVDSLDHLSREQKESLCNVLNDNDAVFSKSEYDIGNVKSVKHSYVLRDETPFRVRHRNLPPRMYAAARDHLNQLIPQRG